MNQTIKSTKRAPGPFVLRRRIGSTLYRTRAYFSESSQETVDDKILRLLKNDLNQEASHGTMNTLQIGRLPEGRTL